MIMIMIMMMMTWPPRKQSLEGKVFCPDAPSQVCWVALLLPEDDEEHDEDNNRHDEDYDHAYYDCCVHEDYEKEDYKLEM